MVEIAAPKTGESPPSPALVADLPPRPTKFLLFPKLPLELRNLVWADAASEPRYVDIHSSIVNSRFFSTSHVPALLHANAESRAVGLKHYKATFGFAARSSEEEEVSGCALEPRIYVNWAADTICVMSLIRGAFGVSEILEYAEGKAVERIAIRMGSGKGVTGEETGATEWVSGAREVKAALRDFPFVDTVNTVILFYNRPARIIHHNLKLTKFRMKIDLDRFIDFNPETSSTLLDFEPVLDAMFDKVEKHTGWQLRDLDEEEEGECLAEKITGLGGGDEDDEGDEDEEDDAEDDCATVTTPGEDGFIERTISIKLRELRLTILA
ncbi:hypothetical protein DL95DRAFT_405149 [Leptodontidium sp. 2 PMI_412]|nr:hypothetical protein DL95DRAFT_405149 [Leptodontidium sp. 2 PMI_412]